MMSVILKENEWAEEMIKGRSLGKKASETMKRIARYYIDKGYNKKDTRKLLDTFLLECIPSAPLPKWSKLLDNALSKALKYKAVDIEYIPVTKAEMQTIDALEGVQLRRLAFTLLCLAKFWKKINPDLDGWVNCEDNEIMSMANIKPSIKRQCAMFGKLKDLGLIQFSKKIDNTNVKVCFIEEGEPELIISDFRNLGYQYLKYHGEPFFECENCGITSKASGAVRGRKQKYCKACAVVISTQQRVNSVMKQRKSDF